MAEKTNELVDFYTIDKELAKNISEEFIVLGQDPLNLLEDSSLYGLLDLPRDKTLSFLSEQEGKLPLASYHLIINNCKGDPEYIKIRTFFDGAFKTLSDPAEIRRYLSTDRNWYDSENN